MKGYRACIVLDVLLLRRSVFWGGCDFEGIVVILLQRWSLLGSGVVEERYARSGNRVHALSFCFAASFCPEAVRGFCSGALKVGDGVSCSGASVSDLERGNDVFIFFKTKTG